MTFVTQIRQVVQRDLGDARWVMAAYATTLAYVAWEGRQMLPPQPFRPDDAGVPGDGAPLPYVLVPLLTFLLAAFVALVFAPLVGPARQTPPHWRTLPIAPAAVWSARIGWLLLAGLLVFGIAWWTLLPMPLPAGIRLEAATTATLRSCSFFLSGALLAMAATSLRTLAVWVLALHVVALIALQVALFFLDRAAPGGGLHTALPGTTTAGGFGLVLLTLLLIGGLLKARQVGWPGRLAAVGLALYLLLANMSRVSPALPAPVQSAQPSLVAEASLDASLRRFDAGGAVIVRSLGDRTTAGGAPAGGAPAAGAPADDALTEAQAAAATPLRTPPADASPGLRFLATVTPAPTSDRVVWRSRSAVLLDGRSAWQFDAAGRDVVIATGTLFPDRALRVLNAAPLSIPTAYTSRLHERAPAPGTIGTRARLTLDVERQQPTVLALVPLDGRPATGPWHPFVRARFDELLQSGPGVVVRLTQVQAARLDGRTSNGSNADLTFVLLHEARGELLYLDSFVNYGGNRAWALAPGLLHARQSTLTPTRLRAPHDSTARPAPDASWYRGATLAVIGWRVVERGALTLEAPVAPQTASRRD